MASAATESAPVEVESCDCTSRDRKNAEIGLARSQKMCDDLAVKSMSLRYAIRAYETSLGLPLSGDGEKLDPNIPSEIHLENLKCLTKMVDELGSDLFNATADAGLYSTMLHALNGDPRRAPTSTILRMQMASARFPVS